jgi:hypothetical protein
LVDKLRGLSVVSGQHTSVFLCRMRDVMQRMLDGRPSSEIVLYVTKPMEWRIQKNWFLKPFLSCRTLSAISLIIEDRSDANVRFIRQVWHNR